MRPAAIIAFIVLAGSVLAAPAGAAQLGIYAGITYAMVEKDSDRAAYQAEAVTIYNAFGFSPLSTVATFDSEDSAYGFVVGYRLAEHLALEGSYVDLGEVKYRDRSDGLFDNTSAESWAQNITTDSSGIALSALGIMPLSYRWELYGRAGLLLSNSTESVFITDNIGSERLRASKSGADLLAGIGISCSVVDIYSLRLEYQRVFDAGDDSTLDEADVDMIAFNITVSF
jgi:hypothetical protein